MFKISDVASNGVSLVWELFGNKYDKQGEPYACVDLTEFLQCYSIWKQKQDLVLMMRS